MKCPRFAVYDYFIANIEGFEASYFGYAGRKDSLYSGILDISAGRLCFSPWNAVRV